MERASEGPLKITRTVIAAADKRRRPAFRLVIRDAECRGLALVVNPTGMTWNVSYRPRGTNPDGTRPAMRELVLGSPASLSPDDARAAAAKVKDGAKGGADPAAERRAAIAKATRERASTVSALVDAYAAALPKRPKLRGSGKASDEYVAREVARVRAAVADMKVAGKGIASVDAADVRALLRATSAQPGAARHRFGALSRFFDWCRDEGLVSLNPCTEIGKHRRPKPLQPRTHNLGVLDLARVWRGAEVAETDADDGGFLPVHRDLARLLIAVPARRSEAARMDWAHLDLVAGAWTQPDKTTKNGDPHRLPLPGLALAILRARWEAAGQPKAGLVFPAPRSGAAMTAWSAMKRSLDKAAGLTGWRWHDTRRSFVTVLAEHGVAEAVADAMLNHRQAATRGGVLGVYQQAKRRPEQEAAMRRWDELLTAAIEGREPREGVVVSLPVRG